MFLVDGNGCVGLFGSMLVFNCVGFVCGCCGLFACWLLCYVPYWFDVAAVEIWFTCVKMVLIVLGGVLVVR